jgi:predicted protein tyrosine phosphatase
MNLLKPFRILWQRLTHQGLRATAWWAADHAVRILLGAPIRRVSQIVPQLYVGGQHRRHGLPRMQAWGVSAVVNMRIEFDDAPAGLAFDRYLHLATEDDDAPTLEHLRQGARFIAAESRRGGVVYIHCGSGIGRAPTMAAAYFVTTGQTPDEAWATIGCVRPFIRPTPAQLRQLERFAAQLAADQA